MTYRAKLRLVAIAFSLAVVATFGAAPAIIPLPQQMQLRSGLFTLCPAQTIPGVPAIAPTKILVDAAAQPTGQYLAALLFKSTGCEFEIESTTATSSIKGAILLSAANTNANLGAEGYELTVDPGSVIISARTDAGVFYGVQSLLQLFPPQIFAQRPVQNVQWTASCVYIQDFPRFVWRGWMLDSVRHFFNKDEVKQLLDAMALNKLNMFHWHLDDDAGWRIEILKWPLLTQVSAWRTNILFGLNPRSSTAWDGDGRYGGFYSQADVREIVAYAAQRHITIVPEIEMPGHSTAAIKAYPQFACGCPTCANGPYTTDITNSNAGGVFCAARPETRDFLHDILTEVMGLFPGPYIHIGGDEVNFSNWQNHSLDQALTNSLGISSMQKYQSYFTQQMADWIKSQGRTLIGWSEILNGGQVTNAALMDWINGSGSRAIQAATNSEYVVMSTSATLYINKWETGTSAGTGSGVIWSNGPPGQSGYVPLPNVYAFEPIPAGLPSAYTNFILGAESPSWSEYIPSLLNMEFKSYPRLCALAEVNWTLPVLKDYTDFTNRLVTHKQRMTQLGVNYNHSAVPPQLGTWVQAQISTSYSPLDWDITTNVTASGEIDVSFCWKTGANGLDIAWAALLENGIEIDRDTHAGFTGVTPSKPAYVLRLPARKRGATYSLRASVAGRGGTASNGIIYQPNWD